MAFLIVLGVLLLIGAVAIVRHSRNFRGSADLFASEERPDVRERVREAAAEAYRAAGCRDLGRVDIILDAEGVPQILEINTIPGLTETGPMRYAAQAAGMDFSALIERVISRVTGS